jgi:uncharacterized membrane protein
MAALGGAAGVGLLVGVLSTLAVSWRYGLLLGWMAAAITFLARLWIALWPMDAQDTRRYAAWEDARKPVLDVVTLAAALVSLAAVALLLTGSGGGRDLQAALSVCSVALAWSVVHTVFMTRYAELYYDDEPGGIDFGHDRLPDYTDFAYLAFTVGMTFQVSDTQVTGPRLRKAVLRQALLSYVFGAVIIATLINLIAGLGK